MGAFSLVNLAAGGLALLVALAVGARRLGEAGSPQARAVVLRGVSTTRGAREAIEQAGGKVEA